MNLAGQILGSYHVLEEIGRGRTAIVYRAYQPSLDRYVAVKVFAPDLAADERFVTRVKHEAQLTAKLQHPNIVVIHDVGQENDLCYVVMEYLQDDTLAEVIAREGPLPLSRAVSIVEQLAAALDHAHYTGIIHGDVRPLNIYLGAEDHVTLTDFYFSRAAAGVEPGQGSALLSPDELASLAALADQTVYLSPEQLQGEEIGYRADLYSLGVVTYELLTGRRPSTGGAGYGTGEIQQDDSIQRTSGLASGLPRAVEQILQRALSRSPSERWPSAGAMAGALQQARDAQESKLKPQPLSLFAEPIVKEEPPPETAPDSRRLVPAIAPRIWIVLVGLLVLGLAVAALIFVLQLG